MCHVERFFSSRGLETKRKASFFFIYLNFYFPLLFAEDLINKFFGLLSFQMQPKCYLRVLLYFQRLETFKARKKALKTCVERGKHTHTLTYSYVRVLLLLFSSTSWFMTRKKKKNTSRRRIERGLKLDSGSSRIHSENTTTPLATINTGGNNCSLSVITRTEKEGSSTTRCQVDLPHFSKWIWQARYSMCVSMYGINDEKRTWTNFNGSWKIIREETRSNSFTF